MEQQRHGGDIYRNNCILDFSVNVNPLGIRKSVVEAIRNAAERVDVYPDPSCQKLRRSISLYEGVKETEVLCGNGATALIYAVVLALKPKKALLPAPTFSEYEQALNLAGTEIVYHKLRKEDEFAIDETILSCITPDIDLLFLCNPNNPTGQVIKRSLLEQVLNRCEKAGCYLVLDECFLDFLDEPWSYEMGKCVGKTSQLLVLKAFTKSFSIPGLRLGYVLGAEEVLKKTAVFLPEWDVSVLAQEAGVQALQGAGTFLDRTRTFLKEEREYMKQELSALGFRVYDSKANYIFFEGDESLYDTLLQEGILIRDCSNYKGLSKGFFRVAVKTRKENERLLACLKRL